MLRSSFFYVRSLLAEHFELFMTSIGVVLSSCIVLSEMSGSHKGMALTFLVWLQGVLIWAVHRHNYLRQRQLLAHSLLMVEDRVNNSLMAWVSPESARSRDQDLASVEAAKIVANELKTISLEALERWERRYARFIYTYGKNYNFGN